MGPAAVALAVTVTLASRAMQPGELVLVTIDGVADTGAKPCAAPPACDVRVRAFNHEIAAFPLGNQRWRALVGIDLDTAPGAYPVKVHADGGEIIRELTVLRKTFPTRRLTVDPDFVTPPASELERIKRDAALLEATWAAPAATRLWHQPFAAPVPQQSNSAFGTRSIFNGQPRNAHGGADFLSPAGTPIHAPNAGRVVVARNLYYSGNTIVIDHGLGVFSMLAHLSAFAVKEGDVVDAGQLVGRVGATGRVTGPHLHWALRVNGARVDPLSLLALAPDS